MQRLSLLVFSVLFLGAPLAQAQTGVLTVKFTEVPTNGIASDFSALSAVTISNGNYHVDQTSVTVTRVRLEEIGTTCAITPVDVTVKPPALMLREAASLLLT